jgi:hypothetical protein
MSSTRRALRHALISCHVVGVPAMSVKVRSSVQK